MKFPKQVIKIIFNLNGRSNYVVRYLNLLQDKKYNKNICFDLLIINEKKSKRVKREISNLRIINFLSDTKIYGMNDIFRDIYKAKNLLKKYKYCCFVEDDNFIYPNSLLLSKNFLDANKDFIACTGNSFLFGIKNKKYIYLNKYIGPNTNISNETHERFKKNNNSLHYYCLFQKNIFLKILKNICKIKDDNLSEIFFNFLAIKYGKIKKFNNIYLAREYPRPRVYNIPHKTDWISNKNLLNEINFIIKKIDQTCSDKILDYSIFKYLSDRFKRSINSNLYLKLKIFFFKYIFLFLNFFSILFFLKKINKK